MKRAALAALLIGVAGLGTLGCGDDDDGQDAAETKSAYIAAANRVCVEHRRLADEAIADVAFEGRPTPDVSQRFLTELVPVLRDSFADRAALEPPEGDEEEVAAIVEAGEKAGVEYERIVSDPKLSQQLMVGRLPDPYTEVDALSLEYGIEECGGAD